LCCAHFGEAQSLFKTGQWQKHGSEGRQYFETDTGDLLLVTGEGISRALNSTASILGKFDGQIASILNFGIAGSMDERFAVGEIHSIRTSYCSPAPGHYEFRSFTAANSNSMVDCISSSQRLIDNTKIAPFRACAPLVDRELWGIAHAANFAKIPFNSIKLISDRVGATDCANVRSKAEEFSTILAHEVRNWLAQTNQQGTCVGGNEPFDFAAIWTDAYFTTAARSRFNRLMRALQLQTQMDPQHVTEFARQIFEADSRFKTKTTAKRRALLQIETIDRIIAQGVSTQMMPADLL
jgi:nucleoside phosphorylase